MESGLRLFGMLRCNYKIKRYTDEKRKDEENTRRSLA